MKIPHDQNFCSSIDMEYQTSEGNQSKSPELIKFQGTQLNQSNEIQFGNIIITRKTLLKCLFILILIIVSGIFLYHAFYNHNSGPEKLDKSLPPVQKQSLLTEQQKNFQIQNVRAQRKIIEKNDKEKREIERKELIQRECYKKDILHRYVFFISFDLQDMPKEQAQKFEKTNQLCNFQINREIAFNYFVDVWNQRQQSMRFDQNFINKTAFSNEERRLLFIWLKLYFWAGIYIHPSLGHNFGKYINDRYLLNAQVGKQLLFAKYDHQNDQGIFVPERNFKTVKVGRRFSEYVRKIIEKIISKEDWMDICSQYQCIIIKDAISFPNQV